MGFRLAQSAGDVQITTDARARIGALSGNTRRQAAHPNGIAEFLDVSAG